jgi:hypothetical protein
LWRYLFLRPIKIQNKLLLSILKKKNLSCSTRCAVGDRKRALLSIWPSQNFPPWVIWIFDLSLIRSNESSQFIFDDDSTLLGGTVSRKIFCPEKDNSLIIRQVGLKISEGLQNEKFFYRKPHECFVFGILAVPNKLSSLLKSLRYVWELVLWVG